jgi:hypothetical protein
MTTTVKPQTLPIQRPNDQMKFNRLPHEVMRQQQVGNYVIYKKTLGAGSMGTVKLAECVSSKNRQLVKNKYRISLILFLIFLYSMQ